MKGRFEVRTDVREQLVDITRAVAAEVAKHGVREGVMHLWSVHTTCGITVNEGADPDVARDIVAALGRLVPREGDYRHAEGNSDAHLKTLITGPDQTLLIEAGRPLLGTWQKIFLAEWDGPRTRTIAYRLIEG
ncbi:MAG TPA: secondary thiamine-phosphate synthase enzyme YjbQ [Longimicrobiales bacterium]|nr:secondary thiamine-phosphate synthase enzyme YjbQ [Longimicrobiales bacterium]